MSNSDLEKATVDQITYPLDAPSLNRAAGYAVPAKPSTIANPGVLGLFCFGSTTLILSLFNLQARGITHPNVVLGMAIFCGGLAQLLAGLLEFPRNNVFGATAFTSYGAFWMSYATILIPSSGVLAAYKDTKELQSALGIFLSTWGLVTFLFFIVTLRKNLGFVILFGLLIVTFFLLAAGEFLAAAACTKAGGGTGVVGAFVAFYIGLSEMLAAEEAPLFTLPIGVFPKPKRHH